MSYETLEVKVRLFRDKYPEITPMVRIQWIQSDMTLGCHTCSLRDMSGTWTTYNFPSQELADEVKAQLPGSAAPRFIGKSLTWDTYAITKEMPPEMLDYVREQVYLAVGKQLAKKGHITYPEGQCFYFMSANLCYEATHGFSVAGLAKYLCERGGWAGVASAVALNPVKAHFENLISVTLVQGYILSPPEHFDKMASDTAWRVGHNPKPEGGMSTLAGLKSLLAKKWHRSWESIFKQEEPENTGKPAIPEDVAVPDVVQVVGPNWELETVAFKQDPDAKVVKAEKSLPFQYNKGQYYNKREEAIAASAGVRRKLAKGVR